ncbi:unnamed protein product [Clonostachys chloroleuca]|uniref:Uncharacterized protein n=1 Tax=Clonostachys chloroleuca TaxID=1926264 RepID=A0AA35M004_9HYPO|nr:unnamed protein product [Clonostachys chloroleuca]
MSAIKDDGKPSPVDLASGVGTWLAAGLAIVALLGVVAPLLAIQSSMSDKNRALNAVQDQPQKYISQGYHLWTGYRAFRRIRVPNLSPDYITNHANTLSLLPAHIILGHCILNPCDFLPWNTGWAKLSELLQAYTISVAPGTDPIPLGVARGGTLEVVSSRTALVVNKYWILLLGLLEQYGWRKDKGVLQYNGIRRDFKVADQTRYFEFLRLQVHCFLFSDNFR